MTRDNCTDTFDGIVLSSALPLTWQGWLEDGKQLMVREVKRAAATLKVWATRTRSRRQLARLDDHLLKDIGLTKSEVARESDKPFWQH